MDRTVEATTPQYPDCRTTGRVEDLPLVNTVFARSSRPRFVTVNPGHIEGSLKSLERNRAYEIADREWD